MLPAKPQMEETRRHRVIVGDSLGFSTIASPFQKRKEENAAMEYDCYLSSPQGTPGCLSRPLFSCSGFLGTHTSCTLYRGGVQIHGRDSPCLRTNIKNLMGV